MRSRLSSLGLEDLTITDEFEIDLEASDRALDRMAQRWAQEDQKRAARGLPPRDDAAELPLHQGPGDPQQPPTMTVYVTPEEDAAILIRMRAEGPGGMVGDLVRTARPGKTTMGRPYEFWQALGPGRHEVPTGDQEAPHA
jgi:hypothetical protein